MIAPRAVVGISRDDITTAIHLVAGILGTYQDRVIVSTSEIETRIEERSPYVYMGKSRAQKANLLRIAMVSNGWRPWSDAKRMIRIRAWRRDGDTG